MKRSRYNQTSDDKFGERDAHGGYVSNQSGKSENPSYSEAHGHGKQLERTNPQVGEQHTKRIDSQVSDD